MAHTSGLGAVAAAALLLAVAGPAPADDPPPTPTPVAVISHTPTGLASISAVSADGRYAIGSVKEFGRRQMRDLRAGTRLKLLPKKAGNAYLSDTGRYMTYTLPVDEFRRNKVMLYDRRSGRTTQITRTSKGKVLRPSWRGTCTAAKCREEQLITDSPQLNGGQISGNGRYVAFCANFRTPGRIDLHLKKVRTGKKMRTGKLRTVKGACRPWVDAGEPSEPDLEYVQSPSVSSDAGTILLQGRVEAYGEGVTWEPGRVLLGRTRVVDIGGVSNSMTRDGRTVTVNGPDSSATAIEPQDVAWLDLATGTRTPAQPPGLRLNQANASADGRLVLHRDGISGPLLLRDRSLGTDYDVEAPLKALGYLVPQTVGSDYAWLWSRTLTTSAVSGDGLVLFVQTVSGTVPTNPTMVAVTWSAP